MVDHLRHVGWDSVEGPYGPATEVPDLLRALRSPDAAVRAGAEEELEDDHLQHQGLVYEAAASAAPFLIDLLADVDAPDRLAAWRLLTTIVDCVELYESPCPTEVPSLDDLGQLRSDWWLARSPEWRRHGGYQRPTTDPWHLAAYQAVQAGVPVYLATLRDADRDLRLGMAQLLARFPAAWEAIAPVLAEQLRVETDLTVAAALCLVAGLAGQPTDGPVVEAVARWRESNDPIVRRAAAMGLARLRVAPDHATLSECCDCLFEPPAPEWPVHDGALDNTAAAVLGGRMGPQPPDLAALLVERLRAARPDRHEYLPLHLLLGLTFPDGPLPEGATVADLTTAQREVVRLILDRRILAQGGPMPRAVGECNLPYTEEALAAWYSARQPTG